MVAVIMIGAIIGALALASIGKAQVDAAVESSPSSDPVNMPSDNMKDATPVNSGGDENIDSTPVETWRKDGITTDYNTWPSGDAIWDICRAIALAEGYDTNGAAFRLNNPGDINDGSGVYGSEWHGGSNITKFPDAATGWSWLYEKISSHINGHSKTYPASMTIAQFALKYAGNWQAWKTNVGRELQVDPDKTSFAQYVGV